jgi:hypothetical protein
LYRLSITIECADNLLNGHFSSEGNTMRHRLREESSYGSGSGKKTHAAPALGRKLMRLRFREEHLGGSSSGKKTQAAPAPVRKLKRLPLREEKSSGSSSGKNTHAAPAELLLGLYWYVK